MISFAIVLVVAALVPLAPDRAELKAKPGGVVRFDYGAPAWQDAFEEQITEGLSWRLSASGENRFDTTAAIVFSEVVVFPGKYNVGALCRGEPDWDLVFHNDGIHYGNGPHAGMISLEATTLAEGDRTKKLMIDFTKEQGPGGAANHYRFDIRFGKRSLSTPFQAVPVKTIKGKAGKYAFTSTYLLRSDFEEMERQLDESEITIARIESKHLDHAARVRLRGGDLVEVVIEREDPRRADIFIDGTKSPSERKTKTVGHAIERGDDLAVLEFTVGGSVYRFDLPASLFHGRSGDK